VNFIDNLKQTFRQGGAVIRLIYINVTVFVALQVAYILLKLFNINGDFLFTALSLPSVPQFVVHSFWTPITYMFLHQSFMHIFFNMLCLFWFGKIFLYQFTQKQLVGLYVVGGLLAGAFYVLLMNVLPYYVENHRLSLLLGASGSIMAIIVASAVRMPNIEMQLMFVGSVKLKYIAIATVLISFFGITSSNAGGEIAHLGGALTGYLFALGMKKGVDISQPVNWLLDKITDLFKLRNRKQPQVKFSSGKKMSDTEFNMNKAGQMAGIDRILDKIKKSGYESLTSDEKKQLFDMGKK